MAEGSNKALFGALSDFWKTGTQELSKNMSSIMSTPATKNAPKSGDMITPALEKWEKDVIEQRKYWS